MHTTIMLSPFLKLYTAAIKITLANSSLSLQTYFWILVSELQCTIYRHIGSEICVTLKFLLTHLPQNGDTKNIFNFSFFSIIIHRRS